MTRTKILTTRKTCSMKMSNKSIGKQPSSQIEEPINRISAIIRLKRKNNTQKNLLMMRSPRRPRFKLAKKRKRRVSNNQLQSRRWRKLAENGSNHQINK